MIVRLALYEMGTSSNHNQISKDHINEHQLYFTTKASVRFFNTKRLCRQIEYRA